MTRKLSPKTPRGVITAELYYTKAPLTVTGNTTSSVYTAAAQTNGFSTSGLLGGDSVTSVSTLGSGTNVGTYNDNLSSAVGSGTIKTTRTAITASGKISSLRGFRIRGFATPVDISTPL